MGIGQNIGQSVGQAVGSSGSRFFGIATMPYFLQDDIEDLYLSINESMFSLDMSDYFIERGGTYSLTGSWPTGISISSVGVLSGTPTGAFTGSSTITVTNTYGSDASNSIGIRVAGNSDKFFVDSVIGSDAYDGTSKTDDGGGVGPKLTPAGAATLAGTLSAGQQVLFNRAQTFTGSMGNVGLPNGATGNHIVIGSYGSGVKPIITNSGGAIVNLVNQNLMSYVSFQEINFTITDSSNIIRVIWDTSGTQSKYITWTNCRFTGTTLTGLTFRDELTTTEMKYWVFDFCEMDTITTVGFIPYHAAYWTIKNCHFHDIGVGETSVFYHCVYMSQHCNNCLILNSLFEDSVDGIKLRTNINTTVRGCTVRDMTNNGIQCGNGVEAIAGEVSSGIILEDNDITGCGTYYIAVKGQGEPGSNAANECHSYIFRYNNIHMNGLTVQRGLHLTDFSNGNLIHNNTITCSAPTGVLCEIGANFHDTEFKNMIWNKEAVTSTREVVEITGTPANLDFDDSVYYIATGDMALVNGTTYASLAAWVTGEGGNASSDEGDPNLVNPGTDNQLTASSALCLDLGVSQTGHPTIDILGAPVPYNSTPDRGAYEYQGA